MGPGSYTVPTQHGSKYPSYVPFSTSTQRGFEAEQSSHEVLLHTGVSAVLHVVFAAAPDDDNSLCMLGKLVQLVQLVQLVHAWEGGEAIQMRVLAAAPDHVSRLCMLEGVGGGKPHGLVRPQQKSVGNLQKPACCSLPHAAMKYPNQSFFHQGTCGCCSTILALESTIGRQLAPHRPSIPAHAS